MGRHIYPEASNPSTVPVADGDKIFGQDPSSLPTKMEMGAEMERLQEDARKMMKQTHVQKPGYQIESTRVAKHGTFQCTSIGLAWVVNSMCESEFSWIRGSPYAYFNMRITAVLIR